MSPAGGGTPEHRPVTIAFMHFDGTDELIEQSGPDGGRRRLDELVADRAGRRARSRRVASSRPTSTPTAAS